MLENPWSAVGNPTSDLGPSGSSFGPSSLAPVGIHHLLLTNLTTAHQYELLKQNCRTAASLISIGATGRYLNRKHFPERNAPLWIRSRMRDKQNVSDLEPGSNCHAPVGKG